MAPMTNRFKVLKYFWGSIIATNNFAFEVKAILGPGKYSSRESGQMDIRTAGQPDIRTDGHPDANLPIVCQSHVAHGTWSYDVYRTRSNL